MNTWMNNPQYLAQVGHFFGAYSLIVTSAWLGMALHSEPLPRAVLALFIVSALVKEFWYDMRYEIPKQSWTDSGQDFLFYLLGAFAGVVASGTIRLVGS